MSIVVISTASRPRAYFISNRSVPYGTPFLPGRTLADAYPIGTVYQAETAIQFPARPGPPSR